MSKYPPRGVGCVYFIQAGYTGPVKIGWSNNLRARFSDLQVGHYEKLYLVAVIENVSPLDERNLQSQLHGAHCRGEWFWPTRDVRQLIFQHEWPRPVVARSEEDVALFDVRF